jgi:hypothetical protein
MKTGHTERIFGPDLVLHQARQTVNIYDTYGTHLGDEADEPIFDEVKYFIAVLAVAQLFKTR